MYETAIDDLDIIFISYDEPLKEHHWSQLLALTPFAKRVDGVTGFDAAHKEAARIAETDRFITVDGDTTVNPAFLDMVLRFDDALYKDHVFSWAGTNAVNGLVYGNGSLKCWPREQALNMSTHESAQDARGKIEFCWSIPYLSMKDSYSVTHPAATPYHGFRAGFREGVKMVLDQGVRVENTRKLFQTIWHGNANKLLGWASLGADHENGLWAIYGARLAVNMVNAGDFDFNKIADYNWFEEFWKEVAEGHKILNPLQVRRCPHTHFDWDPVSLGEAIDHEGEQIFRQTGMYIPRFTEEQSKFFKYITSYREIPTTQVLFPR